MRDSLTYVRSIDGFLVKLVSIIYEVEDYCDKYSCDSIGVFKSILMDESLDRVLSRFSCYLGEIVEAINTDPRHKILRKYIEVIKETLGSKKCVEEGVVETFTPQATWIKERAETIVVEPTEIRVKHRRFGVYGVLKIMLFISILLLILSIAIKLL